MKKQINLNISGMSCSHCVMTVKNALSKENGVKKVNVDLEKKEANVMVKDKVTSESLISAVEKAGYGASVKE
jgi:copper chaperone CopZ